MSDKRGRISTKVKTSYSFGYWHQTLSAIFLDVFLKKHECNILCLYSELILFVSEYEDMIIHLSSYETFIHVSLQTGVPR